MASARLPGFGAGFRRSWALRHEGHEAAGIEPPCAHLRHVDVPVGGSPNGLAGFGQGMSIWLSSVSVARCSGAASIIRGLSQPVSQPATMHRGVRIL